jgi:hypothetical protein
VEPGERATVTLSISVAESVDSDRSRSFTNDFLLGDCVVGLSTLIW